MTSRRLASRRFSSLRGGAVSASSNVTAGSSRRGLTGKTKALFAASIERVARSGDGQIIGLLLTIYPVSRFLLEIIRTDESSFFETGFSISQNVSVLILLAMAGFWAWMWSRPRGLAYAAA